jgi:transposase
MDQALLKYHLDQGLSLPQIGVLVGRDPSTVGYWVQKHGLVANGREKYAPRGGLTREQLEPLVEQRMSVTQIADELGRSASTVRHWLVKYGLKTSSRRGRRSHGGAPKPQRIQDVCRHHGLTEFFLQNRGAYRCRRCASEAVSEYRRRVKRTLIDEAGGVCLLCGYARYQGALQFHHLDPSNKRFVISRQGVTRSMAEARAEAAKCVLLCANCHAEVEAGYASLPADSDLHEEVRPKRAA